jgi:hypothetical protein
VSGKETLIREGSIAARTPAASRAHHPRGHDEILAGCYDFLSAGAMAPPSSPCGKPKLMRAIGRFGQLLGLSIPVFAVVMQLGGRLLPSQMLVMLVAAVCCFGIGRILEGYAQP